MPYLSVAYNFCMQARDTSPAPKKIRKTGGGKKGGAYAACLSKSRAAKLGQKGIASFVKRKRAAQKKAGDSKKGGEKKKGQKTTKVSYD